jgi:polygalacturonase
LGSVWAACNVVLEFGADPTFDDPATIPIQNAIDAAHHGACDGEVYFPPGTYKLTGSIRVKSNVTLNISSEATLKVSENQSDLSSIFRVVYLDNVSNVIIKGGGTIDASGPFYHNPDGTRVSGNRPDHLLFIKKSAQITVENVALNDSVNWTFPIYDSDHVTVDKVTIRNPEYEQARNTDGIDIVASRHVTVRNCDIETGDDAIVLKSKPFDGDTWGNMPDMHDILVEDCVVASTCNATKIGTETGNDIYDVTFRNITVNRHTAGGRNTAGISVQSNDGNWVHDIEFINYTINYAYCPIFIGLQDRDSYIAGPNGKISNITLRNINAIQVYPQPILFNADEDNTGTIENITMEDITVHNYGTQSGRVPDEMDGGYPDPPRYGIADAYGLWARIPAGSS